MLSSQTSRNRISTLPLQLRSTPSRRVLPTCAIQARSSSSYPNDTGHPLAKHSITYLPLIGNIEKRESTRFRFLSLLFIRDQLVAEWTLWKENGRPEGFKTTWTYHKEHTSLFRFIEEHKALYDQQGNVDANNWFSLYRTSHDLRLTVRRRLAEKAFVDTGEKMVRQGQVPIITIVGNGFSQGPQATPQRWNATLYVVNAGPVPAMHIEGRMSFADKNSQCHIVPVLLPGHPPAPPMNSPSIIFDVREDEMEAAWAEAVRNGKEGLACEIEFSYMLPTGHIMADSFYALVRHNNSAFQFDGNPFLLHKRVSGMRPLLAPQQ
jgi:hypothetical protein